MKICITSTFDREYSLGGMTMMKSIRNHTDCRGVDFKAITSDLEVVREFGPENCHFVSDEIKARYANVAYIPELPREKYHHSWYRFEMFSFQGYDRVICIDSDCLCLADMSYLFSDELNAFDIISVEDHIVSKIFVPKMSEYTALGLDLGPLKVRVRNGRVDIQPALIVANSTVVNEKWYRSLLSYANTTPFRYSIDEGILNDFIYLDHLNVKLLPIEYDYQDCYETAGIVQPPSNPIIVHCEESKPFKRDKASLDSRLHKWHDRWWYEHYLPR